MASVRWSITNNGMPPLKRAKAKTKSLDAFINCFIDQTGAPFYFDFDFFYYPALKPGNKTINGIMIC